MPYFCAVSGCGNSVTRNPDVVFHTFPRNTERLEHWIRFCGHAAHWTPQRNQGICSNHFSESSYDDRYQKRHELIGAKMRRKLKTNALPSEFSSNVLKASKAQYLKTPKTPPQNVQKITADIYFVRKNLMFKFHRQGRKPKGTGPSSKIPAELKRTASKSQIVEIDEENSMPRPSPEPTLDPLECDTEIKLEPDDTSDVCVTENDSIQLSIITKCDVGGEIKREISSTHLENHSEELPKKES